MGCRGRAFWHSTGLIIICLGEEPNVAKGTDLSDLERNKCKTIEGEVDKKDQLHTNSGCTCLAMPYAQLMQSVPFFLVKLLSHS